MLRPGEPAGPGPLPSAAAGERRQPMGASGTDRFQPGAAAAGVLDLSHPEGGADVGRSREVMRRSRLLRLILWVGPPTAFLWLRILQGRPVDLFWLPQIDPLLLFPALFFGALIL